MAKQFLSLPDVETLGVALEKNQIPGFNTTASSQSMYCGKAFPNLHIYMRNLIMNLVIIFHILYSAHIGALQIHAH